MKKTLLVLMLIFATPTIAGSGGLVTDTIVRPRPATPPIFSENHKIIDPAFSTQILRITGTIGSNAVYESNETQNLAPIQHFHNPWNSTGDMFLVFADRLGGINQGVDLYSFDKDTFSATRLRSLVRPTSKMNYNDGIKWATDPRVPPEDKRWIVYAVDSHSTPNTIKRWNIDFDASHDGLAPGANEVIHSDPEGINQLTVSTDDNRFSYYTDAQNNKIKVWEKSRAKLYSKDINHWYFFDESQMTPDGQYIFVKGHEIQGQDITVRYDYDMSNKVQLTSYTGSPPDDFAGKHSGYGQFWINETSSGQCGSSYCLAKRKPSDGKGTPEYIFKLPQEGKGTMHPSYSNGYITGGMFTTEPYNGLKLYEDEILLIKDDGSEVARLAHAWSNFYSSSYDEIPSYLSPDANFVLFYSNWNGQNKESRHDVFIVSTSTIKQPLIKNITSKDKL